ncbi:threonine ammonia-lyase [Sulfodiicoccus acidiphilus]|uniref:threonine ammonia-lyase n=1 Tax=Sulfodiicoccus acidiphilus TaxID=1670455 RepID=A0A348B0I0_9CREN|nr:threonine ammonia-lyase [Sulfodiicoccus acidiphilus]GGT86635.1 threonine ammonia-lyase [Sulfodiicoccus acidiphilus]
MTEALSSASLEQLYTKVLRAKERVAPYVHETPLDYSKTFSDATGSELYLKLENLQKTGSFKVRGAFNKLLTMDEKARERGVVAVSAGNHAQGVAFAARSLNVKSVIVMPETAPASKYLATKGYGAEVVLYGKYIHESMKKAEEIIMKSGATLVHPYDDVEIVVGQGTLGLELVRVMPEIVVVPIGGGGLISGITIALKARNPAIKVVGVQSSASPSMKVSKELGTLTEVEPSFSIADGILVKSPSHLTFSVIKELVDEIVVVEDEEIAEAMFLLLERNKTLAEGAGAASLAALLSEKVKVRGKRVVAVISGGNVDLTLLTNIVENVLHRMRRVVRIKLKVPDKPGYLNRILSYVAEVRGNVIDVVHDRMSAEVRPGYTLIYVTFELANPQIVRQFLSNLLKEGIEAKVME